MVIISGSKAKKNLSKIERNQHYISGVIIFTLHLEYHSRWAEAHEIIKKVVVKLSELIEQVKQRFSIFLE